MSADICRKRLSATRKRRFWHLPDICRKCLSKWSETHMPEVSLRFRPTKRKKGLRPTYAGIVSLKGPKHICRKCLSVFARPKGKKPTAHICRKCLSATCAGSVSLNPDFGDVFSSQKRRFWPLFDVQTGLWKSSFLQGTLPRSPGARSPALYGPGPRPAP